MSLLKPATNAPAYLKAGFLGFAGSGKTFTATTLAIGTRAHFRAPGPIAFFDTENGTPFVTAEVLRQTGTPPLVVKSRSLDDLKATVRECVEMGVSVLIVDSITHVWREVCDTYLRRINQSRAMQKKPAMDRLEFQHWAALKSQEMWGGWTDMFLNSPLHIIVCGRAGYEYDFEKDDSGRNQLVKTGVKMKVEGEFGYESSILVEMTAEQTMQGDVVTGVVHRAFVLKDRTMGDANLVGKSCDDPTFEFFRPHVESLIPAGHEPVDTSRETAVSVDGEGNAEWAREKREREALLEEADGVLEAAGLGGQSGDAKKTRAQVVQECFGTTSRKRMENMRSADLRESLSRLRVRVSEIKENTR